MPELSPETAARRDWMGVLAQSDAGQLAGAVTRLGPLPAFDWLRAPEHGSVMVRGRAGATGAAFNLGEMTVTRCTLRLEDGTVGHAYVPGRDTAKAERAAMCDALMQTDRAGAVAAQVLAPLAEVAAARRSDLAGKAEATRVDFFTMVRGEG